jgi:four helix bundle protein
MGIHFKDLDVYRLALDFVELCAAIAKRIPRGQGQMADQLRRASSSSAYNTGEGAGEFAPKEKARFYRIALRSTTESSTIIDIVHRLGFVETALHARAEAMAERLIGMLTKLVHRHGGEGAVIDIERAPMKGRRESPARDSHGWPGKSEFP